MCNDYVSIKFILYNIKPKNMKTNNNFSSNRVFHRKSQIKKWSNLGQIGPKLLIKKYF